MQGTITGSLDVAQVVLYVFWLFAAGLIFYLRREDKREGYPLESERSPYIRVQGFPSIPAPKTFRLPHGGTVQAPNGRADDRPIHAEPFSPALGSPLVPTGNPLVDGVGPAAYANRADEPELTVEGHPSIVPLRVDADHFVPDEDGPNDPRGMEVLGADRRLAGTVRDLWVDRTEPQIRYLEVETTGNRHVLVPMTMVELRPRRQIYVGAILAAQFADAPTLRNPDVVTKLEEDRIAGYFAGGTLYATPARQEPLF
jgi:photosynthetic reaction center H subunit